MSYLCECEHVQAVHVPGGPCSGFKYAGPTTTGLPCTCGAFKPLRLLGAEKQVGSVTIACICGHSEARHCCGKDMSGCWDCACRRFVEARHGKGPPPTDPEWTGATVTINGAADSDPYASLRRVLAEAVTQASNGKGMERHAAPGEPFHQQQIVKLGVWLDSDHYQVGQAVKKALESQRLPRDAARRELLGAINYLAAAVLVLEEIGGGE